MSFKHSPKRSPGREAFFFRSFYHPRVFSRVDHTLSPRNSIRTGASFECTHVHKYRVHRRENWANAFCATIAAWYLRSTPRNCSEINATSLCIYDPPGDAFDRARRCACTFNAYCASKYLLRRKITKVHEIYVGATPGRTAVSKFTFETSTECAWLIKIAFRELREITFTWIRFLWRIDFQLRRLYW
jgi:hypothetical protein